MGRLISCSQPVFLICFQACIGKKIFFLIFFPYLMLLLFCWGEIKQLIKKWLSSVATLPATLKLLLSSCSSLVTSSPFELPHRTVTLQLTCITANIGRAFFQGSRQFCMKDSKQDRRALILSSSCHFNSVGWAGSFRNTLFISAQNFASSVQGALSVGFHRKGRCSFVVGDTSMYERNVYDWQLKETKMGDRSNLKVMCAS